MSYTPELVLMALDSENQNRNKTLIAIGESSELQNCIQLIEKAVELLVKIFYRDHQSKDEETLKIVGFRLSNSLTASINLILTGWWYVSVMLFRDILETIFLLYYFEEDRARIDEWRNASRKERLDKFGPPVLRKSLNDRIRQSTGENEHLKGIDKRYQFYCELGVHPTCKGIYSTSNNEGTLTGWCFFNEDYLPKYLMELVNLSGFALDSFVQACGEKNLSLEIKDEVDTRLEEGLKWSKKHPEGTWSEINLD